MAEEEKAEGQMKREPNNQKNVIEVDGHTIKLEHPGTKWYYEHRDNCEIGGSIKRVPYAQGFLDFVVVSPKLSMSDFSISGIGEFISKVESFLRHNS